MEDAIPYSREQKASPFKILKGEIDMASSSAELGREQTEMARSVFIPSLGLLS